MEFSCTARQADGHVVLTVLGDVDLAAHARFQAEAEPWAAPPNHLIVDCSGVTFLDSMGLRVLVQLRRMVTEDGRDRATITGTPQGGILSPVLANIALSVLDEQFVLAGRAMA